MHVGIGACCSFYLSAVVVVIVGAMADDLGANIQAVGMLYDVWCVPLITSRRGACHTT
jgi:hypothetical protein